MTDKIRTDDVTGELEWEIQERDKLRHELEAARLNCLSASSREKDWLRLNMQIIESVIAFYNHDIVRLRAEKEGHHA